MMSALIAGVAAPLRTPRAGRAGAPARRVALARAALDDASDRERSVDVAEPEHRLLLLLRGQRLGELGGERRRGLVTGNRWITRRRHDAAQIA